MSRRPRSPRSPRNPRDRVAAFVLIALAAACNEKKKPLTLTLGDAPPASSSSSVVAATAVDASGDAAITPFEIATRDKLHLECSMAVQGMPRHAKSIGHTSVVYKIELDTGAKVAFKPNAKKVKDRYKGEIAAYRLASALGIIDNVPAACAGSYGAPNFSNAIVKDDDAGVSLFASDVIIVDNKEIRGAIIPWIDGLGFWGIEKEPLRSESRNWLSVNNAIPPDKTDLARQLSTMIVFDVMTGNWDRWSGGNIGLDRTGAVVLYIDNDAAFMEAPPKDALAKNTQLLQSIGRFSKAFIDKVRSLDDDTITQALGTESVVGSPKSPLVSQSVIAQVAARTKEAIAVIDAKIAAHGEKETLYFP